MSPPVQVFGRRNAETIHGLGRPESEKRQDAKSRGWGTDGWRALWGFVGGVSVGEPNRQDAAIQIESTSRSGRPGSSRIRGGHADALPTSLLPTIFENARPVRSLRKQRNGPG